MDKLKKIHTISDKHPAGSVKAAPVAFKDADAIRSWISEQAIAYDLEWIYGRANDGVFWGKVFKDSATVTVQLSLDVMHDTVTRYSPSLTPETLQKLRLFDVHGELYLWKTDPVTWMVRRIYDTSAKENVTWTTSYDETVLLNGTVATPVGDGFALLSTGRPAVKKARLPHVVPWSIEEENYAANGQPQLGRLTRRHYINENGPARVVASRFLTLAFGD